uniref:Uncharacterized protein n=1 Tax=Chlamydomonas leiostraca TaxID=1034604 RepID=A0A7S0RNS8_9CHLO|mmetsp:Transcript_27695/g.70562  ORF Transcript_27695/g.70562 Transcript_27695/m.70562 type:complete len:118 (+) Transcript_27695:151-504(+)
MAYNLYQVQMARAWAERVEKENAMAEKFWTEQALKTTQMAAAYSGKQGDAASVAGSRVSSAVPSGFTSKTSFLKSRLERLEAELAVERESRKRVEEDLAMIKTGLIGSKPGTPTGHH